MKNSYKTRKYRAYPRCAARPEKLCPAGGWNVRFCNFRWQNEAAGGWRLVVQAGPSLSLCAVLAIRAYLRVLEMELQILTKSSYTA